MNNRERSISELAIDEATATDTLNDVDLSSAVAVYPPKKKKIAIKISLEDEIIQFCKRIAAIKHIDNFTKLIDTYIRDGIENDKKLLK
jgi:hypothetical protein